MRQVLVSYRTKPGKAEDNARLSAEVFKELQAKAPAGVRYLVLRLADDSFVHFAMTADGATPITALDSFKTFQSGIPERVGAQPQVLDAVIVGDYRMLGA